MITPGGFSHQYVSVKRVVILASQNSYRSRDFVQAAELLRLDWILASDADIPVSGQRQIHVNLDDPASADRLASLDPDAVIAVDDAAVILAAAAAELAGIAHNPRQAARATRDKALMRRLVEAAGLAQPAFREVSLGNAGAAAAEIGFPVVLKPLNLSAGQGVIRADDPIAASRAESRVRAILADAGQDPAGAILVESYVDGDELAVEGILVEGTLQVLAVIDKPEPLTGPFFEETLFVTPSRHSQEQLDTSMGLVQEAASALGLVTGPVHAEIRLSPDGPQLIEVAARTIGGLCGRALTFGLLGETLETLVLKSALGMDVGELSAARPASGVLMLPIPASGVYSGVAGIEEATAIEQIDGVEMTVPLGRRVASLPDGDRYLGFVFASGSTAGEVEEALRSASQLIEVTIDGEAMRPSLESRQT